MTVDRGVLRSGLSELSHLDVTGGELERSLGLMVEGTRRVFGADGAGLMLLDESQGLHFVVATDETSAVLERVQQERGEGPCVEAVVLDGVVAIRDLVRESRWWHVREALVPLGARGLLTVPLHVGGNAVGSLHTYRTVPTDWDESDLDAIRAHAELMEGALGLAVVAKERHLLAEQLRHALDHRVTIERAVGLLMGRRSTDAVTAFNELRSRARSERRKVADVAEEVLAQVGAGGR